MRVFFFLLFISVGALANDADPIDFSSTTPPHIVERGIIARVFAAKLGRDIDRGDMPKVAFLTDKAIKNLLNTAEKELTRKGHDDVASELRMEYGERFDGFLTRMVSDGRNIGDHKPLWDWLGRAYAKIEGALGLTICQLLHLSDLKTINYGIPVVFHPCTFPMDHVQGDRIVEYRRHFSGKADGEIYDGLIPVISYWVAWGVCEGATWGTGWFIICSPIATLVEIAEERWITPKLSDKIYTRRCQQ